MEDNLKKILRGLSLELRHILEGQYDAHGQWVAGDLERRLNEIGVWRERPPKPLDELPHLSAEDKTARKVVDAYIRLREEAGVLLSDAVTEFVRESAYTWVNRLFALRCMEARGIIDEVILQKAAYGGRSMVHNRFSRRDPEACASEDEGLFTVLFDEFAARASELPAVFDPDAPATALRPSIAVLKRCVGLLSGRESVRGQSPSTDELFEAPDAFGWAYQYWNTEEKARVYETVRTKKGAKIESADIIPATQLYTESYMVKFLVQNSLGALWMEMNPESKLADEWSYYASDADRRSVTRKPVADITFLDPAVGSGHFLLEAFDMLFAMYEEENDLTSPEEIAGSILNRNLYGIDIDQRATQISLAVLWMRAKERAPNLEMVAEAASLAEFRRHIIPTNIRLPRSKDHLAAFIKNHPEDRLLEPALRVVFEGLESAHELGSLLQIEEPVERELQRLKEEQDARVADSLASDPTLFDTAKQPHLELQSLGDSSWITWKDETLERLRLHFDEEAEAADLTRAFFGETAGRGLDIFDLLARRYDVVAANPPYMHKRNMGSTLKASCQTLYGANGTDLYTSFLARAISLLTRTGAIAFCAQQSFMFLSTYEELRNSLSNHCRPIVVAHLGPRAFHEITGAKVSTVLIVAQGINNKTTVFIDTRDVLTPEEKALRLKSDNSNDRFQKALNSFDQIPGSPWAYWLRDEVIAHFTEWRSLTDIAIPKQGMATGNNERFLRFWWEVSGPKNHFPKYLKGGKVSKYYGPLELCIDYRPSAHIFYSTSPSARYRRGHEYYFHEGITYTLQSELGFFGRYIPAECVFDIQGSCIFSIGSTDIFALCAYLNSAKATHLLQALNPTLAFQVGDLKRLPIPPELSDSLAGYGRRAVELRKIETSETMTSHNFYLPKVQGDSLSDCFQRVFTRRFSNQAIYSIVQSKIERLLKTNQDEKTQGVFEFFMINGYDALPEVAATLPDIPADFRNAHDLHLRQSLTPVEVAELQQRLRTLYEAGPGAHQDSVSDDANDADESAADESSPEMVEGGADFSGGQIRIATETFLEELSLQLAIHPVSTYHLLCEGIERQGWRCLPEERRFIEDRLTVIVLSLLGHRWPAQVDAGEGPTAWAQSNGIIPITETSAEPPLIRRVNLRIEAEFDPEAGATDDNGQPKSGLSRPETFRIAHFEREFAEVVGADLAKWLGAHFFRRHIGQFKKRPIAWQIESPAASLSGGKGRKSSASSNLGPAFSCLVYYHKLNADLIPKLRTLYVGEIRRRYETELRTLAGIQKPSNDQSSRKVQLESWVDELKTLETQLEQVTLFGFGPENVRPKLRQHAIDDAMLSMTSRWLKRLSQAVQDGPLKSWQDAARETFLHEEFPRWIHESVCHLDYACVVAGLKAPKQKDLSVDPSSADLAPIISNQSKKMVEAALSIANNLWWKQFDDAVLFPIRQQVKQLEGEVQGLTQELEEEELRLTDLRRREITKLRKQLKAEITELKKEIRERSGRAGSVRRRIENWLCQECETWGEWLASQPLYDEIASLDGKRPQPTTVSEFITQESIYAPNLNDGVRVNIAPLQSAGLLAADVLAAADLEKAIADRADWRADERRWCREGKLPRPDWWKEQRQNEASTNDLDQIRRTATDTQT